MRLNEYFTGPYSNVVVHQEAQKMLDWYESELRLS